MYYLQIREMTLPFSIDNDLETMLTFYHDLGRIIYFGKLSRDKSVLKDTVILDPQWLIDVLKQVITIAKPKERVRYKERVLSRIRKTFKLHVWTF